MQKHIKYSCPHIDRVYIILDSILSILESDTQTISVDGSLKIRSLIYDELETIRIINRELREEIENYKGV